MHNGQRQTVRQDSRTPARASRPTLRCLMEQDCTGDEMEILKRGLLTPLLTPGPRTSYQVGLSLNLANSFPTTQSILLRRDIGIRQQRDLDECLTTVHRIWTLPGNHDLEFATPPPSIAKPFATPWKPF